MTRRNLRLMMHGTIPGLAIAFVLLVVLSGCGDNGPTVLLQDNFDDVRSGWGANEQDTFVRGYDEDAEVYFFAIEEPIWFAWAHPGETFTDVRVQVESWRVSGADDGHFGVLCRYRNPDNFYYLAISADGYYAIFRNLDGEITVLSADGDGMLFSSAINTGAESNQITAACQGDALRLTVNGQVLATVTDSALAKGDVGLGVGSGPTADFEVQFDDFVVVEP